MDTLYKEIDGVLHYREAWVVESRLIEHWGVVGDQGEVHESQMPLGRSEEDAVRETLRDAVTSEFRPFDDGELSTLVIEYAVRGFGSEEDLQKRYALEEFMDDFLGWTALGYCDGGSIGSGSMEVTCYVVDFEIARRVVAEALKGSPFENYIRLYEG